MLKVLVAILMVLLAIDQASKYLYTEPVSGSGHTSSDFSVKGIDVSHHDGYIDWVKLREADLSFVFIKATEGGDFVDDKFATNWSKARDEGYVVGAYHYYKICTDWRLQATNFISNVPELDGALPPAIDLEDEADCKSSDEVRTDLGMFVTKLKSYYGKEPILYVNPIVPDSFYHKYLVGYFFDSMLWYRDKYTEPTENRKWLFWQYNSKGILSGIKGFVDMNIFNGARVDLEKLTKDVE